jgi:hypothetical protein
MWGAAAALVLLALGVAATFVSLHVRLSAEGRGDPTGRWAVAGGVAIGPVALAGVVAKGIPARLTAQVWRRTFGPWMVGALLEKLRRAPAEAEEEPSLGARLDALEHALDRFERWLDPVDLALFLTEEKRRIEVKRLDVTTRFADADVALVGKLTGLVYVVSSMLGPRITITPEPVWTGESMVAFTLAGDVVVRPGLFVVDVLVYLVKNVHLMPRARVAPTEPHP